MPIYMSMQMCVYMSVQKCPVYPDRSKPLCSRPCAYRSGVVQIAVEAVRIVGDRPWEQ